MESKIYWDLSQTYQNLYSLNESVEEDYSDFVLEYLLDEGYADDVDQAEVILEHMSDDWFIDIIEEISTAEKLTRLRSAKKKAIETITKNPKGITPDSTIAKRVAHLTKREKELSTQTAGERAVKELTGGSSKPKTSRENINDGESDAEREERHRIERIGRPDSGSDVERSAKIMAGIRGRTATRHGQTPQSTSMNVAPVSTRTSSQRRAAAAADAVVGNMDPTYYDKEGRKQKLTSQGETETNYGGRGRKRVTATYQGASSGSGTTSPTPPGSTVDPERRKRASGQGRRPNQS